jgi:iron complex outermembrane receptor protein
MLTMVDGRLAQLPGNGLPQGNLLPTASLDVKSVEVVIGPASALYGPNAHTGVVNVITKTPWDQSGASIALRGGTQDLLDGSARVAGTFGRFGWKLGGQLLRAEDVAPDRALMSHWYGRAGQPLVFEGDLVGGYATSAAKVEGSGYFREGGLQLKAGYGLSQNTGFTLTNAGRNHIRDWRVQYQTVQLSHPRWYAQVTRTVGDAGQSYQLDRLAQVTQAMGGVPEDAAALERQRDAIEFVDESELWDSELQHRRAIGALKLTTGAQARLYRPYSAGTYLDDADERLRAGELGGYVQLDHPVLPGRLRLVGAARLDAHSAYAPQLSPKAAAVVTLAPTHHVRAGYNRAFKSPTILENHLRINDVLLGNADGYEIRDASGAVLAEIAPLEPETVDALELGYKGAFGDRLLVDAVAYYSFYQRFISPLTQRADPAQGTFGYTSDGRLVAEGTPAAGTLFTYANFGRAQVAGGDLGVELALARELSLQASASFIHLVEFEAGDATQAALRLNVPEVKLRGALSARDLGVDGSFASVAARWQSAYVFEAGRWSSAALVPGGQLPARLVVDLNLGWRTPQGVTVSLNVLNLLGDEGVDVLGAPPGERLAWLQVAYELDGLAY